MEAVAAEEQLLVQFQGIIAEYERAQIAERTRRGKKYRAKTGSIRVVMVGKEYRIEVASATL